jgi:hypothetical protein
MAEEAATILGLRSSSVSVDPLAALLAVVGRASRDLTKVPQFIARSFLQASDFRRNVMVELDSVEHAKVY